MKFFIDIALIVLFFAVYKFYDIYTAIGITMVAYLLQFAIQSIMQRKIDKVQMGIAGLVLILGSATLLFRNELFFKWKPTVVYWILALVLYATQRFSKKSLIEQLGGHAITLSPELWQKLNYSWIAFLVFLGILNLFFVYFFSTDVWVHFKLFGIIGLLIAFIAAQGFYISKHSKT